MSALLPASLQLIERGWLSANNLLCCAGDNAILIDSGYVTQSARTVDLVRRALAGRTLTQLINTHSHSDHIGGNAALRAAFGCRITVPAGLDATLAEWDEAALLLSPLGQQAARFKHQDTLAAGDTFEAGGLVWQALAVPGHDMDALAYYNPERRLLISGDALWENGFGVIFPELLGSTDGLAATRQTLEKLGRLPVDVVIPGHGRAFAEVDLALRRAEARLTSFENRLESLVWHALKVIVSFALMEREILPSAAFDAFVASLPAVADLNRRYLGDPPDQLASRLRADLLRAGALHEDGGGSLRAGS